MDVGLLVPHAPPMLLLDKLVEKRKGFSRTTSLIAGERLIGDCAEFYIELVAQTMAAAQEYEALEDGKPVRDGMLVGIDSFSFYELNPIPGKILEIEAALEMEFGPVKIIQGKVMFNDLVYAEGKIKVWEND